MDLIQWVSSQLSTNDFFSGAVAGSFVATAMVMLRSVPGKVYAGIKRLLLVEVYLTDQSDLFDPFMTWIMQQGDLRNAKRVQIKRQYSTNKSASKKPVLSSPSAVPKPTFLQAFNWRDNFKKRLETKVEDEGSTVSYNLSPGRFFVVLKGYPCVVNLSETKNQDDTWSKSITITTIGISSNFTRKIIHSFSSESPDLVRNKYLSINYIGRHGFMYERTQKRPFKSVFLKADLSSKIMEDLDKYLSSEDLYLIRGIPYKRCYLLDGPPGSGKTSLWKAIASYTNRHVYLMNLGMKDSDFISYWGEVDTQSVIVIEDIDAQHGNTSRESDNKDCVSLSCLLNCIDGPMSKHDAIIVLTTNRPDVLDSALIRPGRVDRKFSIEYLDKEDVLPMAETYLGEDGQTWLDNQSFTYPVSPALVQEKLMAETFTDKGTSQ